MIFYELELDFVLCGQTTLLQVIRIEFKYEQKSAFILGSS